MTGKEIQSILVVDDEEEICEFVNNFFTSRGICVFNAQNKLDAVAMTKKHSPRVILLDIRMQSAGDGLDALVEISKVAPESKVIMTTAVHDDECILKAKELGAAAYVTKPLELEELESIVMSYMADDDG